ncbi:DUF6745 domain-containing protein [Virgisporangium aurantiacum]|uniref:DUF6745 domain-containing protein n=1 Tax=Virgisporangium aurantiacum TaxID=175570 RepID=A0A8J4E190_9ACTN|nr:hypothetical protein [Virgisporangium aurantiacum]GIJ57596.1 hypothetical protein Vau01_051120 [Virgisporangium aurantiacum]
MAVRIRMLESAQREAMAPHAERWAVHALDTTGVDWVDWEDGVRAAYAFSDVRWPGRVLRTASPLALARALFLARVNEQPGDENRALAGLLRQMQFAVDGAIERRFGQPARTAVHRGVFQPVDIVAAADAVESAVAETLASARLFDDPIGTRDSAVATARSLTGRRVHSLSRVVPAEWQTWRLHLGGRGEAAWGAYASFFGEIAGDGMAGSGWRRRAEMVAKAQSAGWWYPSLDFVLVAEPPVMVRTERAAGMPPRLHCATGPAIGWRDGWRLYFWHGTRVPGWVIEEPLVERVHAEANIEVRRCAIEAIGWHEYIAQAGLSLVDTADDPGNPGFDLQLYDLPERVWGTPARVLLATNGSAERDGNRRRYGLPVPSDVSTAVHAAAWTYGLTGDQYLTMNRRT